MATPFFTRRKEVVIEQEAEGRFRFLGTLEDDVHHIRATLLVTYPSMTIVEATGEMVRGTNPPFCAGATGVLGGLVGERLHRGFARIAQDKVGTSLGCPHLMEIVTDMGRAAFQVTMLRLRERVRADPVQAARILADPLARRSFVLAGVPQLENTCWVFNRDNDQRFEEEARRPDR
ncbi:MAG: DUF2889 domain-containing protein [Candidatus Rokubacteria bacterium]|nr:DUF2889 domain-containing protein [Candidatus Rokubacteria bacterium]